MRYFLHIGYDGTNYSGWQTQADAPSVQQTIEEVLSQIFKKEIPIHGCGRTDSGVHASQYFAHINIYEDIDFDLKYRLNKNLPADISIYDILEMKDGQHARFNAISRTYDYFIHFYDDPFIKKYSSYYEYENLNIDAMHQVVAMLTKYKDYHAICKHAHLNKHTLCDVTNAQLYFNKDLNRMRFTITSDRFLRGMVRLCMAFVLQVGKGEMSVQEFEDLLIQKKVQPLNYTTLPNGLFLSKVEYPYLNLEARDNMCSFLKKGLGE